MEQGMITITGEELLENAKKNRDKRALSTNETLKLEAETIRSADCRLVAISE
jgi:hypothetical protein